MNTLTQEDISERVATEAWLTDSYRAATKTAMAKLNADATNSGPSGFRIQSILVPISSLGGSSRTALKSARWFAEHTGSIITILYGFAPGGSYLSPKELQDGFAKSAGINSTQLRAILVREGVSSYLQIRHAARNEAADLIIIPADFYKGPSHFWQADPMERLIRHPPCPLLIVGNDESRSGSN